MACPHDRAQSFLGYNRSVKLLEFGIAVITIAAIIIQLFRKILEQKFTPAGFQIAEFAHRVQLFEHDIALLLIAFDLRKAFQFDNIGPTEK